MSTPPPPPPQGGNPYGQPGPHQPGPLQPGVPPHGTPPHGQPGMPPQGQPGMHPQGPPTQGMPGQGIPGGYPGAPVPQPPKKKNKAGIIIAAILVPLALIGVLIAVFGGDDSKQLEVGDCLRNKGSDSSPDLERLDCDNSEATHKVLKKVNGITGSFACTSAQGTEAVFTLQEGSTRFTLCLGPAGD
ncbi:hypothetical protein GL263_04275 [Streptomyces durbertensis]|uniref:Uncharacterized protein n=1 Tax=Streptomyces durbertensis TaxID=2448886 RepID=A0ABR6EBS4_9ACTN|nr:hypothetical protein [Streptomyces durbertensis]MBB1242793.1 hypothetical protein [Streptomyces durbertensis]